MSHTSPLLEKLHSMSCDNNRPSLIRRALFAPMLVLLLVLCSCTGSTTPAESNAQDSSVEPARSAGEEANQPGDNRTLPELAFDVLKNDDADALTKIILTPELEAQLREATDKEFEPGLAARSAKNVPESLEYVRQKTVDSNFDWSKATLVEARITWAPTSSGSIGKLYHPDLEDEAFDVLLFIESGGEQIAIEVDDCLNIDGEHRTIDGFRLQQ